LGYATPKRASVGVMVGGFQENGKDERRPQKVMRLSNNGKTNAKSFRALVILAQAFSKSIKILNV
jgi:hypothetical protein